MTTTTTETTPFKQAIINALWEFIEQRSGLSYKDYDDFKAYRAECRTITRDGNDAKALLRAVGGCDGITAQDIIDAASKAFSGRLSFVIRENAEGKLSVGVSYTTGQYFPTEYRKAVCAVLAQALWACKGHSCMPEPEWVNSLGTPLYDGISAGEWLRREFKMEFGRGIAGRWFN